MVIIGRLPKFRDTCNNIGETRRKASVSSILCIKIDEGHRATYRPSRIIDLLGSLHDAVIALKSSAKVYHTAYRANKLYANIRDKEACR